MAAVVGLSVDDEDAVVPVVVVPAVVVVPFVGAGVGINWLKKPGNDGRSAFDPIGTGSPVGICPKAPVPLLMNTKAIAINMRAMNFDIFSIWKLYDLW